MDETKKTCIHKNAGFISVRRKRKLLGFSYLSNNQATIRVAPKTLERFKDKVRELTSRTKPMPMQERIERLNSYLVGWIGYFSIAL